MDFLDVAYAALETPDTDKFDPAGKEHFTEIFRLGPYGLSPTVDFFYRLSNLIDKHCSAISTATYHSWYPIMVREVNRLDFLMRTWRRVIGPGRDQFVPDGFRELFEVLRNPGSLTTKLDHCPEDDEYVCLQNSFSSASGKSPEYHVGRLTKDFGRAKAINHGYWSSDPGDDINTASALGYGREAETEPLPPRDELRDDPTAPDHTEFASSVEEYQAGIFINDDDEIAAGRELLEGLDINEDDGNWGIDVYCRAVLHMERRMGIVPDGDE
ncbi:hypothetical protein C8J56DRAFT_1029335 [Mycena floridula]|nr:hypothetical protein C8J56DRAFT_1029335 [Mycena floridula]